MHHTLLNHFSKIQNTTINARKVERINKGNKKVCEIDLSNWSLERGNRSEIQ